MTSPSWTVRPSVVAIACGALLLGSIFLPFARASVDTAPFIRPLAALSFLCGWWSKIRKEQGFIAVGGLMAAVFGALILVLSFVVPTGYEVVMRIAMPD